MAKTVGPALILGCDGGVGRALLGVLARSAPGQRLCRQVGRLLLADRDPPRQPLPLEGAELLPPTTVQGPDDIERLIRDHGLRQFVDVSSIDTIDTTRVCDEHGVQFLCTSVEEWAGGESLPTDEAIARLKPPRRPDLTRRGHLVGSGANPGIVNALFFAAMDRWARALGTEPSPAGLDLHAILITEEDTTEAPDLSIPDGVFAMTWSPEHCLEELFEERAFVARRGEVVDLGHRPTERWYRARCGDRIIEGMAVPHEETKTLAWRLPEVEIAFLYRIPAVAREALAAHPTWDKASQWKTRRLLPPGSGRLFGEDRVGVLLCSRRHGEFWLGYRTQVAKGAPYGTNATQLQVAAGIVAGWSQLDGLPPGIRFVEDLDWRAYLGVVDEVLGAQEAHHDPDAPPLALEERAVPAPGAWSGTEKTEGSGPPP